jgi:hypothetical protein
MRPDIQKVVCERSRGGQRESKKTGVRLNSKFFTDRHRHSDFEDFRSSMLEVCDSHPNDGDIIGGVDYGSYDWGPSRHPIARRREYGWDCKHSSQNTKPLYRFLRKNVGRPWNDVFSEVCAHADRRSSTDYENIIRPIQRWIVAQDVFMYNGKPYQPRGHGAYYKKVWKDYPYDGLYVHPDTGILCENERDKFVRPPAPVESIHWYGDVWFVLETFKDRNLECGCVHFKVPVDEKAPKGWYYRRNDKPAVCVHGNEPTPRPYWYVYKFGYHDPNDVYKVIHSYDYEAARYGLQSGQTHTIYYRDVPKILAKGYVVSKKVANRKELKFISNYIAEGGVHTPSPDTSPERYRSY